MLHAVKCHPENFKSIKDNSRPFTVRKLDRPYQVGDEILIQEWDPVKKEYTRDQWMGTITAIVSDAVGLRQGFGVLGLREKEAGD